MQRLLSKKPIGVTLLGAFLILSTGILVATTITLLHPGTFVDRIWDFKRGEYEQMLPYRVWAGTGFLVFAVVMGLTAYGWFNARRWAWWLVQGIFAANILGDVGRALSGDVRGGLLGIVLVAALLVYIRSKRVRAVFVSDSE